MACGRTDGPVSFRVNITNTVAVYFPVTAWIPATGVDKIKLVIKRKSVQLNGVSPTFNVKVAAQVCPVRTDNPDSWQEIAGYGPYTGADESCTGEIDVSSLTEDQLFVRFGVSCYLGGTTPVNGQADLEVQVSYVSCGGIVGSFTQELRAYNTTSDAYVAVTGWIPAIDAAKVIAAIVLTGIAGNFQCKLVYRTAATRIQYPGSWTSLEAVYHTANESNTALQNLSITDVMFVQFGLAFSQSSAGSAPGQATASVVTAVRRA